MIDYHNADTAIPVAFWRALGASQNTFFAESFLDEMAARRKERSRRSAPQASGGTPRLLAVLNLAAEKAGWDKPLPAGRFQGVALGQRGQLQRARDRNFHHQRQAAECIAWSARWIAGKSSIRHDLTPQRPAESSMDCPPL